MLKLSPLFVLLLSAAALSASIDLEQCADGSYRVTGYCPADLESPGFSGVTASTANGTVIVDRSNGTLYGCVTTSATLLSAAEIIACSGGVAVTGDSEAVGSAGTRTLSFGGLAASTGHYIQYVHVNGSGWPSDRVVTSQFTTDASGANVFAETFDAQADWDTGTDTGTITSGLPTGWYSARQSQIQWTPYEPLAQIDSVSPNGGSGKSLRIYRQSCNGCGPNGYHSDGQLTWVDDAGYDELYVEYKMRFQPSWTGPGSNSSKVFRISAYDYPDPTIYGFGTGEHGPTVFWDYKYTSSQVWVKLAFRSGSYPNYSQMTDRADVCSPVNGSNGDYSFTFNNGHTSGKAVGGGDPEITDHVNGGLIDTDGTADLSHEQVFGDGVWHTIGFYVKMNSSAGVGDGEFAMYFNGERIYNCAVVPWTESGTPPKWNFVSFGGNDEFGAYSSALEVEEWYAVDDVVVDDELPVGLQ